MQIAIPHPSLCPRPARSRAGSLVAGVVLVVVGATAAWSAATGPAAPGLDPSGPSLVRAGGSAPMRIPNGAPGDRAASTTTIEVRGGDPAEVRLFGSVTGALAPFLGVTIHRGTGEGDAFRPDPGGTIFDGTLAELPADWSRAIGTGTWSPGERHTFRIVVTVLDRPAAAGTRSRATFRWEARASA